MEIKYYASIENMGDNVTESDASGYREWVQEQIEAEYPEASVEVSGEQSLRSVDCSDDDELEGVAEFCKSLWDKCPWSWVELNN